MRLCEAKNSKAHKAYEQYKIAKTLTQARELGATSRSLAFDLARGHLTLDKKTPPLPVAESPVPVADAPAPSPVRPAVAVQRVDRACQTATIAEVEAWLSEDDPKYLLRSHCHSLILKEQLLQPESLSFRVLCTALSFIEKIPPAACAELVKSTRSSVAALLVMAIGWDCTGDQVPDLEQKVKDRCLVQGKRSEFMTAKAVIVESVGNWGGFEDYLRN